MEGNLYSWKFARSLQLQCAGNILQTGQHLSGVGGSVTLTLPGWAIYTQWIIYNTKRNSSSFRMSHSFLKHPFLCIFFFKFKYTLWSNKRLVFYSINRKSHRILTLNHTHIYPLSCLIGILFYIYLQVEQELLNVKFPHGKKFRSGGPIRTQYLDFLGAA